MTELTPQERDVVIEASHPSRPDREELLTAAVERIVAARVTAAAEKAWDEGYQAAPDPADPTAHDVANPYLAGRAAGTGTTP